MLEALKKLLGLAEAATEEDVTDAVKKLRRDRDTGSKNARLEGEIRAIKRIANRMNVDIPRDLDDEDSRAEADIAIAVAGKQKADQGQETGDQKKKSSGGSGDEEEKSAIQETATIKFMLKQAITASGKVKKDCIDDAVDKLDLKKVKVSKDDSIITGVELTDTALEDLKKTRPSYFEPEKGDRTKVAGDAAGDNEGGDADFEKEAEAHADKVAF